MVKRIIAAIALALAALSLAGCGADYPPRAEEALSRMAVVCGHPKGAYDGDMICKTLSETPAKSWVLLEDVLREDVWFRKDEQNKSGTGTAFYGMTPNNLQGQTLYTANIRSVKVVVPPTNG